MSETTSQWSIVCPKCDCEYGWNGNLHPIPSCPKCTAAKKQTTKEPVARDAKLEEALELVDEIQELAASAPDVAYDFAESVTVKAGSIGETIERTGRVSPAQMTALENMKSGLERWHED